MPSCHSKGLTGTNFGIINYTCSILDTCQDIKTDEKYETTGEV
jgi:hypothetical protein